MKRQKQIAVLVLIVAFLCFGLVSIPKLRLVNAYPVAQAPGPAETRVTPEDLKRLDNQVRNLEREVRDLKSQVRSLESKIRQIDLKFR